MNKAIYIITAIILVSALIWTNAYYYIPDNTRGLYRINRLTHQVSYSINTNSWVNIASKNKFDVDGARKAGYSDTEIINFLTKRTANPFDQFDDKQDQHGFIPLEK